MKSFNLINYLTYQLFNLSWLRVTGYGLRLASYELRVARCGLRVASYELRVASCGLRVAGYGLRVAGYGFFDLGF